MKHDPCIRCGGRGRTGGYGAEPYECTSCNGTGIRSRPAWAVWICLICIVGVICGVAAWLF